MTDDNTFLGKIDEERKYRGLNDNGSLSQRKIERNNTNAPGMLDYDALLNTLKATQHDPGQSLWGFVNQQQSNTQKKTDKTGN